MTNSKTKIKEYFIFANTFAAPFFSDTIEKFVEANSAKEALIQFVKTNKHPAGIYVAYCYNNSDAYHKETKPLSVWKSNYLIEIDKLIYGKGGYSFLGKVEGVFEIDGIEHRVKNWKNGKIITDKKE